MAHNYKRKRVTFYKAGKRFTKFFKSFRKANNAKAAMRKRRWKSSKIR